MEKLLQQLESNFSNIDKTKPAVSQSTVGWQLHHTLLVICSIGKTLQNANPAEYVRKFNKWRTIVFFTKKIPRGRAKAPSRVVPQQTASVQELQQLLQEAKQVLATLDTLPPNAYFEHPFFGKLNVQQAKVFLAIHTNHHLKIIKDIVV